MANFILGFCAALAVLAAGGFLGFRVLRRGPLLFEVAGFYDHVDDGDPGVLVRDVQADVPKTGGALTDDRLTCSIRKAVDCQAEPDRPDCSVLLLSGGGQWGAYGAGLFDALSRRSGKELALPGIGVITGVSTGALQAMMLMVALDEQQTPAMRRFAIDRLVWGYSPRKEREVVAHTRLVGLPLFGSAAGTAPLRKRIVEALRPDGDDRLIEAIARSSIDGYAGFVEAERGTFRYADFKELVNTARDGAAAAEALAAATMASSAMPVFHQQLRVAGSDGKHLTLYDGGVRRSVFFDRAMAEVDRAVRRKVAAQETVSGPAAGEGLARRYQEIAPTVYVVRNGPTVRRPDEQLNQRPGPLRNGQRGYDLLVNESEVGAIAGLRLNNPYGRILLTTADRYDTFPSEIGENFKKDEMFKPAFMARLRDLGRYKAERREGAWWPLSPIG